MPHRLSTFPFSHWALPLILATFFTGSLLPSHAQADDFDTTFRGLGGYTLLRQGDIAGAGDFFRSAYRQNTQDPLILQGLAEVAIYQRDAATLASARTALAAQHEDLRLAWLDAREAHAAHRWADALAGYAMFMEQPAWTPHAIDGIQSIHLELGNLPFRAVLAGLHATHPTAVATIDSLNGAWTRVEPEAAAPSPWDAAQYVATNTLPDIEQAVRDFWSARQDTAAGSLLTALADRHPRDARVQSLLKEHLLVKSNQLPVPPARRVLPAGAIADTWAAESGWEFGGLMPGDLPLGEPLASYWGGMESIFAVSEGYYFNLMLEFNALKANVSANVQSRDASALMSNLMHFNTLVDGAITMSEREIQATGALPVPTGFEAFAAKLREYQDLRTAAFIDLRNLVRTQNTDYADAATEKAHRMEPLAQEAVDIFLQAYGRAPIEWKTPPAPEQPAGEGSGDAEGKGGGLKAEEEMSDGERLYGEGWDFEIPADGGIDPIDEGGPLDEPEENDEE